MRDLKLVRIIVIFIFSFFLVQLLIVSCKKSPIIPFRPPNPHDTTNNHDSVPSSSQPTGPDLMVDNKWQCEVNGVLYSGTIDTSIVKIDNSAYQFYDTIVRCTGTSLDKKANIHFQIVVNREREPTGVYTRQFNEVFLRFDTSSTINFSTYGLNTEATFTVDSITGKKIKGHFNGQLYNPNNISNQVTITNGVFSFEFGKGTNEPKSFSFIASSDTVSGYINYARIAGNTLIMDGFSYDGNEETFRLQIHTGGTIKPGTYNNQDGNAGLKYFTPSFYKYFFDDSSYGSLSVTINTVNGNIVTGTMNGTYPLVGRFSCRVKNYQPEQDSVNRWRFSISDGFSTFEIYGGNMFSAVQTQTASRYELRLSGESDNGASPFLIKLNSSSPITKGIYRGGPLTPNRLDTLYFAPVYDGTLFNYHSFGDQDTYCRIDSIGDHFVSGILYGRFTIGPNIRGGRFQASL